MNNRLRQIDSELAAAKCAFDEVKLALETLANAAEKAKQLADELRSELGR